MKNNPEKDSLRKILENIRNFTTPSENELRNIPISEVNSYLIEAGIIPGDVSKRLLKKIEKIKAKSLLTQANQKRNELIEKAKKKPQQMSMENIRGFILSRLNNLTQNQKLILAHRDLTTISDEDLLSLAKDLNLLDDCHGNA